MTTTNERVSVPIAELLGLLFIGLKLTHVIDWSWWWVLSPFWIPLVLVTITFVVALAVFGWVSK